MRHLAVSSYTTQGNIENGWKFYHVHEEHGSVCWFFLCFYHPLHRFLQCARLNKMAQHAIIPDRSIVASNFSKWEEKGPHRNLLFSWTFLGNHFMVSKESPVYVFLRFPHILISKLSISITVTSDSFSSMLSLSSTGKSSTMSSFLRDRLSNMALFLDILIYRTIGIENVSVLCVP